jgi:predicted acylesterase/phospholipase RssA/CRP-like cAMP-binding protein
MTDVAALARSSLFAGLGAGELEQIAGLARFRSFEPGEHLCEAGESADRCWVITAGLVDVLGPSGGSPGGEVLARHRKGATVGEISAILGEPQPESVIASIATSTLELDAEALRDLIQRFPQIFVNVLRSSQTRLAHARARSAERAQGEVVTLAVGASLRPAARPVVEKAQLASPRPVTALDRQLSFAGAVTAADELASTHTTVLLPIELDAMTVSTLMRESDRVVALAGTAAEVAELEFIAAPPGVQAELELVLVGRDAIRAGRALSTETPLRVIRTCEPARGRRLSAPDLEWLARHLTRTKLGLALGAGGAKGYAHVGVLQVLEEAGYVVDYVAGSSIGAIVGTYLALGSNAREIEETLRAAFDPPTIAELFRTSLAGRATGFHTMERLLRETTGERTFADTQIPLTVMAVDLTQRAPAPLHEGPLWQALLAATALAGLFAPYERDGHRLVDGLALVPVPTGAVLEAGADITVSVNLISSELLATWPGAPPPEPPPERRRRGVLDDLLEVMDLSQLSESVRHAELADVPITPRFGPHDWRDFHLADQFLAAGRAAAEEQLPALRSLALPGGQNHSHEAVGDMDPNGRSSQAPTSGEST